MKVTLVAVSAVNGFITRGGESDIYAWTSPEDLAFFNHLRATASLIIMGRKTYEAAKAMIQLSPQTLRVVLTSQPELYREAEVKGQLEFTADEPQSLINKLASRGYTAALLVGGGEVNGAFMKAGVVTHLMLTFEPQLFGGGQRLLGGLVAEKKLSLDSVKQLNAQGTLVVEYKVEH